VAVEHLIIQEVMELLALEAVALVDVVPELRVEMDPQIQVVAVVEEVHVILQQVEMVDQELL
jgi:hypothetical protein|tara:strand:+ start:838 stop:1023 length:186 start_codon:yes stop_codon:yes gene_type:complete